MKKIFIILCLIFVAMFIFWSVQKIRIANPVSPQLLENENTAIEIVATDLVVPWEMVFITDDVFLVTERRGVIKLIGTTTQEITVPNVVAQGEGGLLGVALHPDYETNKFIYLYFTTIVDGIKSNRVVRYTLDGTTLTENKVIVDTIPASTNHNGGRIAFGPDERLYIATGDSGDDSLAQDISSLAGKILRVQDDGAIPTDNPFGNEVYSYGHRNVQGIAWDAQGGMWATEHGRSGVQSGFDELNFIEEGSNYGWPIIEGDEVQGNMKAPVIHSGATTTWAPADIAFLNGLLYFVGLRGQALYEVPVTASGNVGEITEMLKGQFGRLRSIEVKDDALYISTSNYDGRGSPQELDDKIIKMSVVK